MTEEYRKVSQPPSGSNSPRRVGLNSQFKINIGTNNTPQPDGKYLNSPKNWPGLPPVPTEGSFKFKTTMRLNQPMFSEGLDEVVSQNSKSAHSSRFYTEQSSPRRTRYENNSPANINMEIMYKSTDIGIQPQGSPPPLQLS